MLDAICAQANRDDLPLKPCSALTFSKGPHDHNHRPARLIPESFDRTSMIPNDR